MSRTLNSSTIENINADVVINVQGDEPFIDKISLSKLIDVFKRDVKKEIDLALNIIRKVCKGYKV